MILKRGVFYLNDNELYLSNKKILLDNFERMTMFLKCPEPVYMDEFGYMVYDGLVYLVDVDLKLEKNSVLKIPVGFDVLTTKALMKLESKNRNLKELDLGSISVIANNSLSCLFIEKLYAPNIQVLENHAITDIYNLKEVYLPSLVNYKSKSFDVDTFKNVKKFVCGYKTFSNNRDVMNFVYDLWKESEEEPYY